MKDPAPPRILVVDDEPVMRTITSSVLGQHGFEVATLSSAEETFDWIAAGNLPDLILLDVLMPGMNGFDACRTLRRNPRLEYLPVIMLTALDDQASIDEAYRSGATDFITKPLNIPLLPHRVRYLLRSAQAFSDLVHSQLALINTQQIARLGNWSMDGDDNVIGASREFLEIVGAMTTPVPVGQLLERVHGEDRLPLARRRAELRSGQTYQIDYRLRGRHDAQAWVHVHERGFPRLDGQGCYLGAEGFTQDISDRVAQEERIRELAWHDPVTGLNNRTRLIELLERDIGDNPAQQAVTVLFAHLANLRELSTVLGHGLADAAARVLARRLRTLLEPASCESCSETFNLSVLTTAKLARYDEDSFVVAFPGVSGKDGVRCFAQLVHDTLGRPMMLQGEGIAMKPFIGIASLPEDAGDSAELMRRAMLVALRAVHNDGGDIRYFDPAHDQEASRRMQYESGLRLALEHGGQLLPYLQPKICAHSGRILGAEVLLRWRHPELGLIPPSDFIPVAENAGLIHPISEWLIGHVCELIADWQGAGVQPGILSINLSAESFFRPTLIQTIEAALARTGVSARQLVIELTESVLMQNAETARQVITNLRARGLRVSLDDFGTGFSSLGYLNSFEIDEIKIDRSFILNLGDDDKEQALVRAIVTLGHALGLDVVAEGVETTGQAEHLRQMGCDIFQGFLFARPMPAVEFGALPAAAAIDVIDLPLDELVKVRIVSTPKFAENPDQIPSAISVLTAEDIRIHGWRTLGDALRSLQGFNITEDHTYSYAGIRGMAQPGDYRPRMQILVDGVSIIDNIYASVSVDSAFPLDIGMIERIEVIRGPGASVYGGDAMFGVINVVTRGGLGGQGTEFALAAGSGSQRQLRATWMGNLGGAAALLSASTLRSAGRDLDLRDLTADGSPARVRHVGADDGQQLYFKLRGADWRFTLLHSERRRTVTTGSYETIPNDSGHFETDGYSLVSLTKDWRPSPDQSFQVNLYAGRYGYDGDFPYDYTPDDPRLFNVDKTRGRWWGIENRWTYTGWRGHRLTLGLEYRANTHQDQRNFDRGYGCFDFGTSVPCLDDHARSHQFTLLAQDEIQIGDATLLTLGLRHDRLGELGSFWSPRLGLVHDAGEFGLLKALYGFAFRVPTVYELYYRPTNFPYGNPSLRSEQMDSLEFVWEKRFNARSRLSATLYGFEVRRMVFADAATGQAMNGAPVRGKGLELEYEARWGSGVHLRAGYTLQNATQAGVRLDNSPRRMAKLNLAVPAGLPHLTAGFETQWIDRRLAAYGSQSLASYLVANLNLSYRPPNGDWEAGLGIYNLFDRRFDDPVSPDTTIAGDRWRMPQLGRSLRFSLQLRY